jgi:hypothetical protein
MATDYKPKSAINSFKLFLESGVYEDFLNEVDVRIEDLRDFLEFGDGKKFHETRGAVAFARQVKDIFTSMLENRKADIEEEGRARDVHNA